MEWVEVRGKSVDVAVEAAMVELGVDSRDRVDVEVIQAPEKGFLGIGSKDAVVRVKPKPAGKRRRRRRRKGQGESDGARTDNQRADRPTKGGQGRSGDRDRRKSGPREGKGGQDGRRQAENRRDDGRKNEQRPKKKESPTMSIEEQAPIVEEFLTGLVGSFGLEGDVSVEVDAEVIIATIEGRQTEAMVGPRGRTIEAIHELTKTVLQRQTQSSARLRLDIAGYGERRRQALSIYAGQLIDQVVEEGGEVVLEPMSAGDRKVIHDAVNAREGVRSYSEGEAPRRYVVIAATSAGDSEEEE